MTASARSRAYAVSVTSTVLDTSTLRAMSRSQSSVVSHVWTAPASQEGIGGWMSVGVHSCVRPVDAAGLAAGPDAVRGSAPNQFVALKRRMRHCGLVQSPVRPVRHHTIITLATAQRPTRGVVGTLLTCALARHARRQAA
jgi:hypothetical protein